MNGLDDGIDGLNDDAWSAAWARAEREDALRRLRLRAAKLPARRLPTSPTGGKP